MSIRHLEITADTDELKELNYKGSLKDYAAEKLNQLIVGKSWETPALHVKRVININEYITESKVYPNDNTNVNWYIKTICTLSVWVET